MSSERFRTLAREDAAKPSNVLASYTKCQPKIVIERMLPEYNK